jgi:hypothetical protein
MAARIIGVSMNKISIVDGGSPADLAAVRVDLVAGGVCQQDAASGLFVNPGAEVSFSSASDSIGPVCDVANATNGAGRSELDDWRIALHEAGHTVVGRALGEEVGGVTIVEGPDYGGLTWGPKGNSSRLSSVDEQPDLCAQIAASMPAFGEPRVNAAEVFTLCHVRVVDLCAGTAAETLLHPACAPWIAHSDVREARKIASMVCTSESAIDAYLAFGLAEAKALITQHRAAVLAIAESLMVHRTLDSTQIDNIIAAAPERARRIEWNGVLENAASFTVGLES